MTTIDKIQLKRIWQEINEYSNEAYEILKGNRDNFDGADGARAVLNVCNICMKLIDIVKIQQGDKGND